MSERSLDTTHLLSQVSRTQLRYEFNLTVLLSYRIPHPHLSIQKHEVHIINFLIIVPLDLTSLQRSPSLPHRIEDIPTSPLAYGNIIDASLPKSPYPPHPTLSLPGDF